MHRFEVNGSSMAERYNDARAKCAFDCHCVILKLLCLEAEMQDKKIF